MIKIYIRNKWNGMVAIRDKYIKEARETKQDIELRCGFEFMTIPLADIDKRIRFTKGPIEDRFSKEKHMLVYFWWSKDKAEGDPVKKELSARARTKAKNQKLYDEAAALHARDPDAWHKKYVLGMPI